MSFTRHNRAYFFRANAPVNLENKKINFQDNQRPDQDLFEKWATSYANFNEASDRARQSAGGAIGIEVGLVLVAADSDVISYTSGLKADRTAVVHAEQLTEVDEVSQIIPATNDVPEYSDIIIEKNKDAGSTVRNKFIPRFAANFISWIVTEILPRLTISGGTVGQVLTKVDGTDYNVQWETPNIGEDNDGANVGGGTGEVFRDKTGLDLNFKTLQNADTYIDIANGADQVGLDINEVNLLAYMQSNLTFSNVPFQSATNFGGGSNVFKQVLGTDLEFRTIVQGAGILVAQNANDVTVRVDDTYINSLIAAAGSGGVVGIPYLFHATSLTDQLSLPVGTKIKFLNDYDTGNFDNGNTWSTSQWEANAEAVGENLEVNVNIDLEVVTLNATGGAGIVMDTIKESSAGAKTILDSTLIPVTGIAAATVISTSINNIPTGAIVAGDKIYLEVSAYGATSVDGEVKVNTGSTFYNVTA